MTKQLQLTDGALCIDNSALANIKLCQTYARYAHIEKRIRAGASAKGRGPGKAWHSAMEILYKMTKGGPVTAQAEQLAQTWLADAMKGVELCEGDDYLNLQRLSNTLTDYIHGCTTIMGKDGKNGVYRHPGYLEEPFEVLGVEVPFAVKLGTVRLANEVWPDTGDFDPKHVPVIYIGRSDAVIRQRERGEVMVLDHKTGRRWDASTITQWNMAAGPKGYASCIPQWVREGINGLPPAIAKAMEPHEPVREALAKAGVERIAGFELNSITMRDSTDLTRCKQPPTEFRRHLVYYDDSILTEWRTDALNWCKSWLEASASGTWTMNDRACHSVYGRQCPYLEVDTVPVAQRELVLSMDLFEDNVWSPLAVETD